MTIFTGRKPSHGAAGAFEYASHEWEGCPRTDAHGTPCHERLEYRTDSLGRLCPWCPVCDGRQPHSRAWRARLLRLAAEKTRIVEERERQAQEHEAQTPERPRPVPVVPPSTPLPKTRRDREREEARYERRRQREAARRHRCTTCGKQAAPRRKRCNACIDLALSRPKFRALAKQLREERRRLYWEERKAQYEAESLRHREAAARAFRAWKAEHDQT